MEEKTAAGPLSVNDRIAARSVLPVLTLRSAELRTNLESAFRDLGEARNGDVHDALAPLLETTDRRIEYVITQTTYVLSPTGPTAIGPIGYQQAADQAGSAPGELSPGPLQPGRRRLAGRPTPDGPD